jgi:hypothetical protein
LKVLIDENLPPALARALAELFAGKHRIEHLRERYGPRVKDEDWIKDLNADGGWIVISGDRRITRSKSEQRLFRSSNLIGFFLSKGLYKAPVTKKMERLMALWDTMEKAAPLISGGAMLELPMRSTRLNPL